jgi:hypothetical protein
MDQIDMDDTVFPEEAWLYRNKPDFSVKLEGCETTYSACDVFQPL